MDEHTKAQLQIEEARGQAHQSAWDNIIFPFFEAKEKELHQAFINAATGDTDALLAIKMQHNVLRSMQDHFNNKIDTGRMARKTLEDESDE